MKILGHTTLEMTKKYIHLQTDDLRAAHNGSLFFQPDSKPCGPTSFRGLGFTFHSFGQRPNLRRFLGLSMSEVKKGSASSFQNILVVECCYKCLKRKGLILLRETDSGVGTFP
jgi:hypothetical protein